MKILNLKKYTNPFKWEAYISYSILFKKGKEVKKTVCRSTSGTMIMYETSEDNNNEM